jgi:hypothetical protein
MAVVVAACRTLLEKTGFLDRAASLGEPLSNTHVVTSVTKAGLHLPSLNGIRALSFGLVFHEICDECDRDPHELGCKWW